jgi:SLOG-like protein
MSFSIFLSSSVPLPSRNPAYFETADPIAIRDAIRALIAAVVPVGTIVFGGHPAITPMIRLILLNRGLSVSPYVELFQSRFFEEQFPPEVREFENLILVDAVGNNLDASVNAMRESMIRSHDFRAAVFIGGMEGVENEYQMFRRIHPTKPVFPIASTGAAALRIHREHTPNHLELLNDLKYLSLFRRLLNINT